MKRVRTTKTAMREAAQDRLMAVMAESVVSESDPDKKLVLIEQFRRVEKFFGYEPSAWLSEASK